MRYCPRIRALHGVGHGADARLGRLDRRHACLSNPTGSYAVFLSRVSTPDTGCGEYVPEWMSCVGLVRE
jgi:hypothetical protein